MRKIVVILLSLMLIIGLVACNDDVSNAGLSNEEMNAESLSAISQFGTASTIIEFADPTTATSEDVGTEYKNINADEDSIKSTYYLVGYESISPDLLEHLNAIPKEAFHIPGLNNKADLSANYIVLFRSGYFKGKDKAIAAYRKVYLLDKSSIKNNGDVFVQVLSASPDFEYDIENQIEISTGLPKKYNWVSGNIEEADRFVEDNSNDFSDLFGGESEIKAWKFVKPDGSAVTATHSVATYILEVDKTNAGLFFNYAMGSMASDHLRIRTFTYENEDKENKAYLEINKYPDNYIHAWETRCFWHDGETWNYTRYIQTDADLEFIWYKDVKDEKLASFFTEAELIGNITKIYQGYKGDDPLLVGNDYEYIVEYDDVHENLLEASINAKGKYIGKVTSSTAGLLEEGTVAYIDLYQSANGSQPLRACILSKDTGSTPVEWYTSYTYLQLFIVDEKLVIDSKFLNDLKDYHYDYENGKYRAISRYDSSLYYCEYEGPYNFEATLAQLGTVDSIQYYTGGTGQTAPFIETHGDSPTKYIIIGAQLSDFDDSLLGAIRKPTWFKCGTDVYSFDYTAENKYFVELSLNINTSDEVYLVELRLMTNPERINDGTRDYATTYTMDNSFLLTE